MVVLGVAVQLTASLTVMSPLPGVAVKRFVTGGVPATVVLARLRGRDAAPFHYRDKGNLATIGRARAVADVGGLRLSGFIAWTVWVLLTGIGPVYCVDDVVGVVPFVV